MTNLSLPDWLARLEQLHPKEIELGLERIRAVARNMDWGPGWKPATHVVTIAGTNGKGSTIGVMESILIEADIRVGSYTSPHLIRYNERVRIDGNPVPDSELIAAFEAVEAARGDTCLTYFEFGTLAALKIISDRRVEIALLEVGLGGRLDAVNLVDPDLSIITGIALDHMDWLGDTREAIGAEKAGILRNGKPAVIGDPDPPESIRGAAERLQAHTVYAGTDFGVTDSAPDALRWWGVSQSGQKIESGPLPKTGIHPLAVGSALQALSLLPGDQIGPGQINSGLEQCRIPGRCQVVELQSQLFILDVSHNPQAAAHLAEFIECYSTEPPETAKRRVVVGMLRDKQIDGTIAPLVNWCDEWIVVPTPGDRGMSAEALATQLRGLTTKPVITKVSTDTALEGILQEGRPGDTTVIYGSFSVVGSAMQVIAERNHS